MSTAADDRIQVRQLGRLDYDLVLARMREFTARRVEMAAQAREIGVDAGIAQAQGRAPGDEIWLTEHPPVFTLGLDGSRSHLLAPGDIPVVETERGGQVTYHGPGQVVAYILVDLRKRKIGVRTLVDRIESATIRALAGEGIEARRVAHAPGLYVGGDGPTGLTGLTGPAELTAPAEAAKTAEAAKKAEAAEAPGATGATASVQTPAGAARTRQAPVFAGARKIASIGLKVSHGFSYHGVAVNGRMDLTPFNRIDPCGYAGLRMTDIQTEASTDLPIDLNQFAVRLGDALAAAIAG